MTRPAQVRAWGHACVSLEREGRRLVMDPGGFSDLHVLDHADAVLVTHEHPDHVEVDRVVATLRGHREVHLWAPHAVVGRLVDAGAPADRVHAVMHGERFTAAGFDVQVLGEWHAPVHPSIPTVANVAYLVDGTVLHPGDSFTLPPAGAAVGLLLLPVNAPWLKLGEVIDYLHAVAPGASVPIHDAVLDDRGTALVDRILGGAAPGTYHRLTPGETYDYGDRP